MYTSFDRLSDEARVWIYQASRSLESEEREAMLRKTEAFLERWTAHGSPLQCSAEIFYNQFLVLAVEESVQNVTGCAVDDSVRFVRELEETFQVSLLDRTHIAFKCDSNNLLIPLNQLKEKIQRGTILSDMLTFDNTITGKKELAGKWLVRAGDSWLRKYFRE